MKLCKVNNTLAQTTTKQLSRFHTLSSFKKPAPKGTTMFKKGVAPLSKASVGQQTRGFNIHEYQAMQLFQNAGVNVPKYAVASTPEEAYKAAVSLECNDYVVKAQVFAGGRGLGTFANGFKGGVQLCTSPEQVQEIAAKMLNQKLITKQTGPQGKPCDKVLITERLFLRREVYFAIAMDRQYDGPVIVASPRGGVDIESVAATSPEAIFKEPVNLLKGIQPEQIEKISKAVGFSKAALPEAQRVMKCLYDSFVKYDCTLVEVNPLAETPQSRVYCVDGKLNFDANAEFRQKSIFSMRDERQEDVREVKAEQNGLNYIGLDGNIGCLVNGAGLAMATMDSIKLHGGNPANFLDLGGGATERQVTEAFKLLNSDRSVKAILVNIFGGIMRCDVIALGLIKAATEVGLKKPLVVRLAGTNVAEAKKIIEESGLRMLTSSDLNDAAQKAVRVVDIVTMAEQVNVSVNFELPL